MPAVTSRRYTTQDRVQQLMPAIGGTSEDNKGVDSRFFAALRMTFTV
jgi:hypothetical protein